jgi:hypothetical protein
MGLIWAWLSDGPCRGARWPFIYVGAVINVSQERLRSSYFHTTVANNFLYCAAHVRCLVEDLAILHKYQGPYGCLLAE